MDVVIIVSKLSFDLGKLSKDYLGWLSKGYFWLVRDRASQG